MLKSSIAAFKSGDKPRPRYSENKFISERKDEKERPKRPKFKVPFKVHKSEGKEGGRKRKAVDYAGMGGGDDGEDDADAVLDGEDEQENGRPKKKAKKGKAVTMEGYKGVDENGRSLNADNRVWETYKAKEGKTQLKSKFAIPLITNAKTGLSVQHPLSNAMLGVRAALDIPPRPLHDPMGDHAIVLFDPTIDDRDAEREKARIQQEQAAVEEIMASQDASNTVNEQPPVKPKQEEVDRGPHKSLARILGIRNRKEEAKVAPKVPVVIDPILAKVLRPHQVEGVKVRQCNSRVSPHMLRTSPFAVLVPLRHWTYTRKCLWLDYGR